jgi:carbon storage regulator
MLVLSRMKNECIVIGGHIVITVVELRGNQIRLGIDAPRDVPVHRQEVQVAINRDRQEADTITHDGDS